jgi:hypothetical protein
MTAEILLGLAIAAGSGIVGQGQSAWAVSPFTRPR